MGAHHKIIHTCTSIVFKKTTTNYIYINRKVINYRIQNPLFWSCLEKKEAGKQKTTDYHSAKLIGGQMQAVEFQIVSRPCCVCAYHKRNIYDVKNP